MLLCYLGCCSSATPVDKSSLLDAVCEKTTILCASGFKMVDEHSVTFSLHHQAIKKFALFFF